MGFLQLQGRDRIRPRRVLAEKNKDWYYGIDNLAFDTKTTAVPLPATLPLLLAAAGGLFLAGMRRKTRG